MNKAKTLATWFFATAIFTVACANYDEGHHGDDAVVVPPDHGGTDAGVDTPRVDAAVSEPTPDATVLPDAPTSPDAQECEPEHDAEVPPASTCIVNHDCGQNAECRDHKCRYFCNYDFQCENGLSCRSGECRP